MSRARLAGRLLGVVLALAALVGCRVRSLAPSESAAGSPALGQTETEADAGGNSNADSGGAGGELREERESGDAAAAGAAPTNAADRPRPSTLTCADSRAPRACETRGDSSKGVRLLGTLLTPVAVLARGVLDLDAEGNVRCAACDCGDAGEKLVIDCPDSVISPGLINLHDHLGYAGTAPLPHPGELYEHRSDWRLGENGHAALPFEGGASAAEILAQELRMVLGGATSIVGAGGKRGLLRNLDVAGLSEDLWAGEIRAETFPLDDSQRAAAPADCAFGATPDTRESTSRARAYVAHVGEGTSSRASDELRCALGELNLLGRNSAIVHAMALTRRDAERLAERGASVVWSPRSNLDLYGSTAPVALLSSLGVRVAVGTDWLASGSMSLLRELACVEEYDAQVLGGYFDTYQLWRMVTENAAWALGVEGRLGALAPGLVGDVAVFRRSDDGDAYGSVARAGAPDVRLVLRQGQPLVGDAALIAAFEAGEACEELFVCGEAKRVCALETGSSLARIQAAGEAVYPLFSCGAPPDEPRCEARVARECPAGERECPPPAAPPAWDEADADRDGVPDVHDVCPRIPDPAQADSDADRIGDACDPCPVENPGLTPCPRRIAELRGPGAPRPPHFAVTLTDVRVTALRVDGSKGLYIEDGDRAPHSGIFAYTQTTPPAVTLGEAVVLRGYLEHFQGNDQLTEPRVVKRRVVGEYPALSLTLEELLDGPERWSSMRVRLGGLAVTASNADAPRDYDETLLTGGLRLDDALWPELDNTYPEGQEFRSIQGIFGFSFGNYKLWPASPSDLDLELDP